MIKGIINTKDIISSDMVIIEAPYEKTASSHKGTAQGPRKIVQFLNTQIEFFNRKFKKNVCEYINIAHKSLNELEQYTPEQACDYISKSCSEILSKDKFIMLLGGEHSVSLGLLRALSLKYQPSDVTILQIDAHTDLRNDDSDYSENPSPFAHSTVMRRASDLGYNIVQVGIRTYSEEEFNYFNNSENRIKVYEWGDGKKIPRISKILKSIKTKYLYITIDVDGFDPAYMPGTGTPVQGGIEWWYGIELIEKAIKKVELVGADIVEVSPIPDSTLTEYGAAELCYRIIANKYENKLR